MVLLPAAKNGCCTLLTTFMYKKKYITIRFTKNTAYKDINSIGALSIIRPVKFQKEKHRIDYLISLSNSCFISAVGWTNLFLQKRNLDLILLIKTMLATCLQWITWHKLGLGLYIVFLWAILSIVLNNQSAYNSIDKLVIIWDIK